MMIFTFPVSASADDVPKVDASIKIYDYAELLTEDQEKDLALKAKDILAKHNIDIAIVTANSTNGLSSMEYADDFYDYNSFGYGEESSGLLMLINMEEREVWISTTGKAITIFSDGDIETLLDAAYEGLSQGNYYKAGNDFLFESEVLIYEWENFQLPLKEQITVFGVVIMALFLGFGAGGFLTFVLFIFSPNSISGKPHISTYRDNFKITYSRDNFLSTNTTQTIIPKEPVRTYSSGGSSSGRSSSGSSNGISSSGGSRSSSSGSTTHRSSSGKTHGGGGRKF